MITLLLIAETVGARRGVTLQDLRGERRTQKIVGARHVCYWLAQRRTCLSSAAIGRWQRADHTSVTYGAKKIEAARAINAALNAELCEIERDLLAAAAARFSSAASIDARALAIEIKRDPRRALALTPIEIEALADCVVNIPRFLKSCSEEAQNGAR